MRECEKYCLAYWDQITRHQSDEVQTLIGLPYPFLVPNHQMFQEMYYWDTYFMCIGLLDTDREQLIIDCTNNLLYLFRRFGRIPNTSRYYHLSRSQPPFLSSMIQLTLRVLRKRGEYATWLREAYLAAGGEYSGVWNGRAFPDHRLIIEAGLSRYYDIDIWHDAAEAESGWDMTPRFDGHCLDFCPVDLNSILFRYAADMAEFADQLGEAEDVQHWQKEMGERKAALKRFCKGTDGFFYDYNFVTQQQSKFRSVAGFFPLWAGLVSPAEAERLVERGLEYLEVEFGVATTEEWHPTVGDVGKQWAWPNGWAPLHWLVVCGLERYGFHSEAQRIAAKWTATVERVFAREGKNFEKYNVVKGSRAVPDRYPDQEGFGWTNAVYLRFVDYLDRGRELDHWTNRKVLPQY